MNPLLLVSASYDNQENCAVLKFFDEKEQKIVEWKDNTGHMPFCYTKSNDLDILKDRNDILEIKKEKKLDILADKEIEVNKIIVTNPLTIGGGDNSIRNLVEAWESDIRYQQTYLFDTGLVVGKYYNIIDGKIKPAKIEISDKVQAKLTEMWKKISDDEVVNKDQFKRYAEAWAELLNQPIPKINRLAVDIEVETHGKMPDPEKAEEKITAIGLDGTNHHHIYVLKRDVDMGENELPEPVNFKLFEDEKEMIKEAFKLMDKYPFVLTYNGDDFDMPYLYNRAKKLGIVDNDNPLYLLRNSATLKKGIHIDLYKVFNNRSLQIYAFAQKYKEFGLGPVSTALLGETKIEHGKDINDLNHYEIANYCWNDSRLTLKLTTYGNDLVMNLLVIICRISRMAIDELSRVRVSQWIKNLLYFEHRKRNELIPKHTEFEARKTNASQKAIIEGKKYRGAVVMDPQEGVHFGVTVMDFASLYPSIIKVKNISYETVRCPHEECKDNKIPQTKHWACKKKNGLLSLLIGSLRDLRVNYYKHLSKDKTLPEYEQNQYETVQQALKVFLNASYGVMGAEVFPLFYLPSAEAVTALGRHIISKTVEDCTANGINVLYGDTDSMFVKNPTKEQIETITKRAKDEYDVELEVDKEYRYVVLSGRKKNYFGVFTNGKTDVKGLTGKKSHTPRFIKNLFEEMKKILSNVQTPDDFEKAKNEISTKVGEYGKKLENRQIPLEDLSFNLMLSRNPEEYTTTPQHIRAVNMLKERRKVQQGEIISYIKTKTKDGVKPVEMALPYEVDVDRYMDFMENTLEQIIEPMKLDFERMLGRPAQTSLDRYFR